MARSPIWLIVPVVVLGAVAAGAFVAYRSLHSGHTNGTPHETYQHFVGFDGGRAIVYEEGAGGPLVLRGVARTSGALQERWRWSGPAGGGFYPWEWSRRGDLAAGELHPVSGEGPGTLE